MTGAVAAMAGAGVPKVDLPTDVSRSKNGVGSQTATVTWKRDGTIVNDQSTQIGVWITPRHSTIGDNYDVKYDYGSGDTLSSGAAASGTYIAMSSDRSFSNTQAAVGTRQTVLTWSVRRTGAGSALDTATGTITATRDS